MTLDLITENENKLVEYWKHYNKCLQLTHNSDADEQEYIELGKAANQWRLQTELVDKLKREKNEENKRTTR
jgi:hypothetical protein